MRSMIAASVGVGTTSSSITGICILLSASEKTGGWRPANRIAIEVLPLFDSEVTRYPGMRARRGLFTSASNSARMASDAGYLIQNSV